MFVFKDEAPESILCFQLQTSLGMGGSGCCCACEQFLFGADAAGPWLGKVMSLEHRWMDIKTPVLLLLGGSGVSCPPAAALVPPRCLHPSVAVLMLLAVTPGALPKSSVSFGEVTTTSDNPRT